MSSAGRDSTFDFVKGALVVVMVVYHVMSIAAEAGPEHFRYIRFVSGSFIFVTGFVLARFSEHGLRTYPLRASQRLIMRGCKILLIFTVLNLVIHASGLGNVGKAQLGITGFIAEARRIYLLGDGRIASFVILLPIAYLLIAAPALLRIGMLRWPWGVSLLLIASLGLAAFPAVTNGSAVIEFLLVGIVGVATGQLLRAKPSAPGAPSVSRAACAIVALTFFIWLTGQLGFSVASYALGIALVVKGFYDVGKWLPSGAVVRSTLVLLGRYSLVAYIGQIVVIQILFRILGKERWAVGPQIGLLGVVTLLLVIVSCVLLERGRQRSAAMDKAYRFVFS